MRLLRLPRLQRLLRLLRLLRLQRPRRPRLQRLRRHPLRREYLLQPRPLLQRLLRAFLPLLSFRARLL